MELHIIRIYRRGLGGEAHGKVEQVGNDGRWPFCSLQDLLGLLRSDATHPPHRDARAATAVAHDPLYADRSSAKRANSIDSDTKRGSS